MLNGVAVDKSYCDQGVDADAVVSVTKPPVIAGVAGTGGDCASDSNGRPTWLVFSWIQYMLCIHAVYASCVYMLCIHAVYTCCVYMLCIHAVSIPSCGSTP